MPSVSVLAVFSAGVVCGIFLSQQYAIPNLGEGVKLVKDQAKKVEEMYKKRD